MNVLCKIQTVVVTSNWWTVPINVYVVQCYAYT